MVNALNDLITGWRGRAPTSSEAELPSSLPALPPAAGLALYRTCRALTNVLRHSVAVVSA